MEKFLKILIFLTISLEFATSLLYTADSIDKQLLAIRKGLITEEAKIEQSMLDFVAFIKQTNTNLKTQNLTQTKEEQLTITNIVAALENLATLLTDLLTLDSYWPYNNLKTCADVNRKVTEIDFDIRQYYELVGKVSANISRLAQHHGWVAYYYTLGYSTLSTCYKNETDQIQRIATVLATSNGHILEYYNYIGLLARAISNETIISTYMFFYKRQYCSCTAGMSGNGNVGTNLSTLETNVEFVENPLIEIQNSVLSVAKEALSKAKTAVLTLIGGSAPSLSIHAERTKTFLTGLVTANDYRNITWNNVTSCNDLNIRIGYVWFKYYQYLQTLIACNTNMTWTYVHRSNLNATSYNVKLNDNQLVATRNLISAMMKLEPLMRNYSSQLTFSVVKMVKIWIDLRFLGDSYCGCADNNKSTSAGSIGTTTTLKASTTSGALTTTSTTTKAPTTTTTSSVTTATTKAPTTTTTASSTTTTTTLSPSTTTTTKATTTTTTTPSTTTTTTQAPTTSTTTTPTTTTTTLASTTTTTTTPTTMTTTKPTTTTTTTLPATTTTTTPSTTTTTTTPTTTTTTTPSTTTTTPTTTTTTTTTPTTTTTTPTTTTTTPTTTTTTLAPTTTTTTTTPTTTTTTPTTTTTTTPTTTTTTTPTTSTTTTPTTTTTTTTPSTTTTTTTPTTTTTTTPTTTTTTPTTTTPTTTTTTIPSTTTTTTTPTTTTTTTPTTTTTTTPTTTTTTTMTTTTPKVYPCANSSDLYNPGNVYLKSICWVDQGFTYSNGQAFCRNHGMELYGATNVAEYNALNGYSQILLGQVNGAIIWINGAQMKNNAWFVYNPVKTKLYAGANPGTTFSAAYSCLLTHNFNGPFQSGTNYPCTQKMSIYCEYKK